jgi:hypothetical protein
VLQTQADCQRIRDVADQTLAYFGTEGHDSSLAAFPAAGPAELLDQSRHTAQTVRAGFATTPENYLG